MSAELAQDPINGKTGMQRCLACCSAVTGPGVLPGCLNHLRAHGIQNDRAANFQKMTVLLDQDGSVPALEQMPCPAMPLIEKPGSRPECHPSPRGRGQGGGGRPVIALIHMLKSVQKVLAVCIVFEHGLLFIAP